MLKKVYQIFFVLLFATMIFTPLIFTDWTTQGVSEEENRNLAALPELFVDGKFNESFTADCETWFMDHMGKRQEMINLNAWIQYFGFERLTVTNHHLGADGDLNYATEEMILDYAHQNLRSEQGIITIADSYQTVSDWCESQGIQFYYVQCWDKHSIYPEQFMDTVNQKGDVSKTDQVIKYLEENTTVNVISLKEAMLNGKQNHETYSNWGDASHWTERGAFIGYQTIMDAVNKKNNQMFRILKESDYEIKKIDMGQCFNKYIHVEDVLESFAIRNPQATKVEITQMGKWGSDYRHSVWENSEVNNDSKVLFIADSYIHLYIVEDFAESFSKVWLLRNAFVQDLCEIVEVYQPDIIIFECAERVDKSYDIIKLAESLHDK